MQTKRTLFEIGNDLLALDALIEELGGDISDPSVEKNITDWFNELARDESVKLDGWVGYIRQLEMEIAAAKAEADQFILKAKARETRVSWLKHRMKLHLETGGRSEAKTAAGRRVWIQANGGNQGVIYADKIDINDVPGQFVRVVREVDENAVRAALKRGETLEFARLADRGNHLRIK